MTGLGALLALCMAAQVGSSSTATIAPAAVEKPAPKQRRRPAPQRPKKKAAKRAVSETPPPQAPAKKPSPLDRLVGPPLPSLDLPTTDEVKPLLSKALERIRSGEGVLALVVVLGVLVALMLIASQLKTHLQGRGLLARIASGMHALLRVSIATVVVFFVVAQFPAKALPFVLVALVIGVGWAMRDVLPDLLAGVVIAYERRIRRGIWVSGREFSGVVERVGFRATWLRDGTNRKIAVPNRALVAGPVTTEGSRWPMQEVTIRIDSGAQSEAVRRALIDAVLTSPWTPASEAPTVRRDGSDPNAWHVPARVIDLAYAAHFEGELLERTEEILSHRGQ